jgi:hypothetical protein
MSKETECKELKKNRAYLLNIGNVEISALKLEGYKATQLGGTLSPVNVSLGGAQVEGDDWLIIVKDEKNIVMPYNVWVSQIAEELNKATGSNVNTISVVSSDVKVSVADTIKLVDKVTVTKVKGKQEE